MFHSVSIYVWITLLSCILAFGVFLYTSYQKSSTCMTYFLLSMFGIFFTCLISLLEITSKTVEEVMVSVKLGYIGRIVCALFLPKFLMEYCHIRVPKRLEHLVVAVNILFVSVLFTTEKTKLFYETYALTGDSKVRFLSVTPGPFYYPMLFEIYALMSGTFVLIMIQRHKKKDREIRKKYSLIGICILCPCIGLVVYMLFMRGGFDLMPCSLAVSSGLFFFAMRKHFLFDIAQNGKDYVMDNAKEAVVITDAYYNVLYVNQKVKVIDDTLQIGQSIAGKPIESLFEKTLEFEKNGLCFESHYTPLYRKDGKLEGHLVEARDHTKIHHTMAEINRFKMDAENAYKAKSEFLANMSHEIRTPINAILGMNEMILRENEHPVIGEYSMSMQKAGNALLSLVNDILDFSKLESGKMEYQEKEYDTKELLISLKKMIETDYPGKRVHFEVQINKKFPRKLYGDVNRVTQLIMNGIANASESIMNQSTVVYFDFISKVVERKGLKILEGIGWETKRYPEIWLQMKMDDKNTKVTPEAFDMLVMQLNDKEPDQAARYDKDELKSAIISRLMVSMNARLYMNLEEDGTVSTVLSIPQGVVDDMPIGEINMEVETTLQKHGLFEAKDASILVVDDNETNLKVIQALLKRTCIQLDFALSGQECIRLCEQKKYDLVFMDHLMPEMDGIQTLHKLRELEDGINAHVPIVILTANAIQGSKEMYLDEGFSDFLMKPVISEELEDCILRFLDPGKVVFV